MAKKQTPSALSNVANTLKGKDPAKMTDATILAIRTAAQSAVAVEAMSAGAREGKRGLDAHRAALIAAGVKLTPEAMDAARKGMLATVRQSLKLAPNPKARTKPLAAGAMAILVIALFTSAFRVKSGADLTPALFEGLADAERDTMSKTARRALARLAPRVVEQKTHTPQERVETLAKRIAPDITSKGVAKLVQAFKDALEAALAESQVDA